MCAKEPLIYLSHRLKPVSSALNLLDSGFRRNDDFLFNQRFPNATARRMAGLTLIELVMFIVIVSIALVGILSVFRITTAHSADPLQRKQALAIAEALLEEVELARMTYCDPADANVATAADPTGCASLPEAVGPEAGNSRPFDNVNDYVTAFSTPQAITGDVNGVATIPAGYTATLTITPEPLNGIASDATPANMNVLRITVTVIYNNGNDINDRVTLEGYRTRYAPKFTS